MARIKSTIAEGLEREKIQDEQQQAAKYAAIYAKLRRLPDPSTMTAVQLREQSKWLREIASDFDAPQHVTCEAENRLIDIDAHLESALSYVRGK